MAVGQSKSANFPKILDAILKSDCDYIVFPEMALTGHNNEFSDQRTDDARAKIGIDTLYYAGSHGHLIEGPGGFSRECGQEFLPDLGAARAMLDKALADVEGALVERKRYSVAVHVRQVAPGDQPRVHQAIREVLAAHPRLRLGHGKKVFEIRPRMDWDKGRAVLWLLETLQETRGPLWPIYVGDDITDEDAFVALDGHGSSIVVGELDRETAASYALADVAAVGRFLDRMLERTQQAGKVA